MKKQQEIKTILLPTVVEEKRIKMNTTTKIVAVTAGVTTLACLLGYIFAKKQHKSK